MKDTMQATGTGATSTYMFPITMEEATARLNAFNATGPEVKGWRAESARRDAWYDVTEAKAKLARRQMECAADSAGKQVMKTEHELEAVHACRRLGIVFDGIAQAAEEMIKAVGPADAVAELKAGMLGEVAALESKIAGLRERDVVVLKGNRMTLKEELRGLTRLFNHGGWRNAAKEDKAECLRIAFDGLNVIVSCKCEPTEESINARIAEIHELEEAINETERNCLTDEEHQELEVSLSKLRKINARIEQELPADGAIHATAAEAREKFNELLGAAMIEAASVVEVYLINCERLALI